LDDERPKPGVFLDKRRPLGVYFLVPARIRVIMNRRRRSGALPPFAGSCICIPHDWHPLAWTHPKPCCRGSSAESASKFGRFDGETTALVQRFAGDVDNEW